MVLTASSPIYLQPRLSKSALKRFQKIIDKKQNTLKNNKVIVLARNVKNAIAKWNEVQEVDETPVFSMNCNQYAMAV